ncbi:MAG: site-specific DNA-methyltransferase [Acidobacteria bacterium]|nr:site-specific DNA-methyltransferase [Acidobacteriota bacterium]
MHSVPSYKTAYGQAFCGDSLELLSELPDSSVGLVMTSPPFVLQRPKEYGNLEQDEYLDWMVSYGRTIKRKLREDGSFVIDLGGAYRKGVPSRSLYNFRLLLRFVDELGFHLAEDFYWFNPSKLPSPIEWVNKRKLRAKDAVNTVWWLSKTEWPKADIRRVLAPYSERMKKLIADPEGFYTPKKRPSGHDIGASFASDNGGSLPSNLLNIPNTESNGQYLDSCRLVNASPHPARFPAKLPAFFVEMLTDPDDLVVDIFAGSNTTGQVAESSRRRWLAFELDRKYVAASALRFLPGTLSDDIKIGAYQKILAGETVDLTSYSPTPTLFEIPA